MQKSEKKYTPGEEFANSLSHSAGAMLAIYALVLMIDKSRTATAVATSAVYGAMIFLLFQASACYHAMTNTTAKKVFRIIDHSAIYLLIAGTYTPILMLAVPYPTSVALLAGIWYLGVMGVVFSCLTLKFRGLSIGLYLLMGWLSIFLMGTLWSAGPDGRYVVQWMLTGGIVYSLGIVFYVLPCRYMHSIWHLFVIGGALCHFLAIYRIL